MTWLMAHLVGDYILQTDWMAQNKKRATWPCLVHVALYTLAIALFTGWPLWALGVVAVTHFIQDRTNIVVWSMRAKGQKAFCEPPMAPWSVILVDNIYHLLVLFFLSLAIEGAA